MRWAWGRSLQREVEGYSPPDYVSIQFSIQDAYVLTPCAYNPRFSCRWSKA
jgi:hypothetical protein